MKKAPAANNPEPKKRGRKVGATSSAKGATRRNCVICGSEVAPFSEENLCWVCRRLKVSAWGESTDTQMFAAE